MLTGIVAVGKSGQIGLNGKLPWYCPEDLKEFKKITLNKKVIVGRITYLNMPTLKNRDVYVLTNDATAKFNNATTINFEEALNLIHNTKEEIFIIGGNAIYKAFISHYNKFIVSYIDTYEGAADTHFFFPILYTATKILTKNFETFTQKTYII